MKNALLTTEKDRFSILIISDKSNDELIAGIMNIYTVMKSSFLQQYGSVLVMYFHLVRSSYEKFNKINNLFRY